MWKGKEPGEADLRLALYNGDVAVEVPMLWWLGKQLDGGFSDASVPLVDFLDAGARGTQMTSPPRSVSGRRRLTS
jgi:hypothetical protein